MSSARQRAMVFLFILLLELIIIIVPLIISYYSD